MDIILCLDREMHHLLDWVYGTFSTLCTFEVPFLPSRQSLDIWDELITLRVALYHHTSLTRGMVTFLFYFEIRFIRKPIRSSVCDCQHCLAATQAQWVFLHRLIKRHYCSLMSGSPCLSVGCVDYNCYQSFPLESTRFLGLAFFFFKTFFKTFFSLLPSFNL